MTTSYDAATLYALLPATIRARDTEAGQPLYALLAVVADQISVLEDNLAESYADLFIETCADWVVPYIGDLVGTTPLFDSARAAIDGTAPVYQGLAGPSFVMLETLRSRADVAKTIHYRRSKATRPMLEGLAADVTGWPAFAAEMFQRLRWTQCVRNHLRPSSLGTPDLRDPNPLDVLDGPFDQASHSIDVRRPTPSKGWYQVPNVAFFLWRLQSFPVFAVSARPVSGTVDWRYHFSPLGNPAPLFAQARASSSTAPPLESQLPAPIRRLALASDLRTYDATPTPRAGYTAYYGRLGGAPSAALPVAASAAFTVVRDGDTVPPEQIQMLYLDSWCQPQGNVVGVDPVRGRISFGTTALPTKSVDVYFYEGFSAPIGGGGYKRQPFLVEQAGTAIQVFPVDATNGTASGPLWQTIGEALTAWSKAGYPPAIVSIKDSRTYAETLALMLPAKASLTIEAADQVRPHLRLATPMTVTGADDATLTLSGLLVEGAVDVTGPLGTLRLLHTTLVPGTGLTNTGAPATTNPSLVVSGGSGSTIINASLQVLVSSSITGPLHIPATAAGLYVADSIIDGIGGAAVGPSDATQTSGPPATILRSTVFGTVSVIQLTSASEAIFTGVVTAARRQVGCCRFSYVPPGSSAPRRYRCQPDLEIAAEIEAAQQAQGQALTPAQSGAIRSAVGAWLVPAFTSPHYGDPGYAQLAASGPSQIAIGAEDGSEMGVFSQLKQPQRTQNLVTRLGEYLPLGLAGAIVYVT
jgi:hypothetical protein